jgi:serine/threonine protein kinase
MISDTYTLQKVIGRGGSSKVFSAIDREGHTYALKTIRRDKEYTSEMESMMVMREYMVMMHIGEHPNIIKHYSCNPEGDNQTPCYNVMEYCQNGSLSSIIKKSGAIEENICRFMFLQLAAAVQHLHSKHFCHLDLKLENTFLDEHFNLKLGDFGSGLSLANTNDLTSKKVGTPLYIAPEVKQDIYNGLKADIYSLGVTLCLMLLGELPDTSAFQAEKSTVGSSDIEGDSDVFMDESNYEKLAYLSNSSKDLLSKMMDLNPDSRPSIDQILAHEWVTTKDESGMEFIVFQEMQARTDFISADKEM